MHGRSATVAEVVADALRAYGVPRVFGVPGGGSNLEIIEACAARGIDYVLTHTETAAAIMASVTGELTGTPGVVATGLGPGAAAAVNGVAYASLDRAPLLVLTDSYRPGDSDRFTHQKIDHARMFAPLVKAAGRADLVHVKDMAMRGREQLYAEVGEGNLNWPAILDACEAAGARWYIVEQDTCQRDPFESLGISLRNLKGMGLE